MIPLTTQDDLDKAVELLDRSVHMKSLKILLVLQNLSQVSRFSRTAGKTPSALILNLRFTWIILLMMISSLVSVKFFVFDSFNSITAALVQGKKILESVHANENLKLVLPLKLFLQVSLQFFLFSYLFLRPEMQN